MKTLLITIFILFATQVASGQYSYRFLKQRNHSLYASGNILVGHYKGGDLGINFIYNNNFTFKIGYTAINKIPVTPPSEFLKSATNEIQTDNTNSFENSGNIHLLIGKVFFQNSRKKIKAVIQIGPGLLNSRVTSNWRWDKNDINISNYEYDTHIKKHIGFIFNPKLEFPIVPAMGMSLSPMYVYSKENTFWGIGIGLIYGVI
jgi:hypothetical protein